MAKNVSKNSLVKVTTSAAPDLIKQVLKAKLVPMLHGSPGIGKSSISKQIAESANLKVIDLRLSQCDPTDLSGFPFVNKESKKAGYVPMDTFPIQGDKIPDGYKGWLLLLDEFNSAPMAVQTAAYKLILDRQVGQHDLHDNLYMIAAGNLETDKAITNRLSTAMQSRLVHLEVTLNYKDWIKWANQNKLDYRISSFINFKPEMLHKFDPEHNDYTFPCARTWEFVSKLIDGESTIDHLIPVIAGTIGKGAAAEFLSYVSVFKQLPDFNSIVQNPLSTIVSDEPSVLFAITGLIANNVTKTNFDSVIQYLERLPIEFQTICLQNSISRCPEIENKESFDNWLLSNSQEFIS